MARLPDLPVAARTARLEARVPPELIVQLDAEVYRLRALHPALKISRTDVLIRLVQRALSSE